MVMILESDYIILPFRCIILLWFYFF